MLYNSKEFTQIKGYTDYYICKETTEVLSTKERKNTITGTWKILKQVPNSKNPNCNYFLVTLVDDKGKRKNAFIHRLMAETFIPNPNNKPQVNHIDGNKQNNQLENLEWVTCQENDAHARRLGLTPVNGEKPINQFTLTGELITSYKSLNEAYRKTNIQAQNISKVLRKIRKQAGGFYWEYK